MSIKITIESSDELAGDTLSHYLELLLKDDGYDVINQSDNKPDLSYLEGFLHLPIIIEQK